jgi:hypothetical protein
MTSNDNTNQQGGRATARVQERGTARPAPNAPRAERRPEMIRQRREQRSAAYEREQRNWMLTKIGLIAFGVVVVAVIGWLVFRGIEDRRLAVIPEGVANYSYTGGGHSTEPVEYAENPPVGGEHNPAWQNCGFYSVPIANENAVHSLEHGAVWITYSPDLPADEVDALRRLADQPNLLVSPYDGLPTPVVASSWNHQLQLESVNDERLDQFIRSFVKGPDTPEINGACFGGLGAPE